MIDSTAEVQAFWNARYAGDVYAYGKEPNTFLTAHAPPLAPGSAVLSLGDGEGRNGVWLARQGAKVTSMDLAGAGLEKARRLAREAGVPLDTLQADVTLADLGTGRWDLIAAIFLHLPAPQRRSLNRRAFAALKPGGRLLHEAYGPGQRARGTGGPRMPELLAPLADVLADFDGLADARVLHRFEGVRSVQEGPLHNGDGEVVQVVVARAA